MKYQVSVIQFEPAIGDTPSNISTLMPLLDAAIGSHLIVLPELSNAGYNFKDRAEAMEYSETIGQPGLFQDFLKSQASLRKVHIVSGICERDGNDLFNTAILVGPGGILGKYRKIHLFMNEKDIFRTGNSGLPVFDTGGFKIGMLICFDYLFPEPWRILAQKGADIVCHPSNLLTENAQRCIPGIALMNRIHVATANRIGDERGIHFNGNSFLTDPSGRIIRIAAHENTEVISCSIDTEHSRNKMVTARNHVFNDRRPELYVP
jgi:predicted amidohydrolase